MDVESQQVASLFQSTEEGLTQGPILKIKGQLAEAHQFGIRHGTGLGGLTQVAVVDLEV